jgi:AcrR family transcriptional regulator
MSRARVVRNGDKSDSGDTVVPPASTVTVVQYGRHRGAQRTRLDATAWVDAGIQILVRQSIDQVGVERLAKVLGVTKGSFYWHFKNKAELQAAILDRWTHKATLEVKERVQREQAKPEDRLFRLLELPFWSPRAARAADLELAIRAWSRRSVLARRAVQQVDTMRAEFLTEIFAALGFRDAEASSRAHLAYAFMRYLSQLRDVDEAQEHQMISVAFECLISQASKSRSRKES